MRKWLQFVAVQHGLQDDVVAEWDRDWGDELDEGIEKEEEEYEASSSSSPIAE